MEFIKCPFCGQHIYIDFSLYDQTVIKRKCRNCLKTITLEVETEADYSDLPKFN